MRGGGHSTSALLLPPLPEKVAAEVLPAILKEGGLPRTSGNGCRRRASIQRGEVAQAALRAFADQRYLQ